MHYQSAMADNLPFDDTAIVVVSEMVGQRRMSRAATVDEWPPEPRVPAPPPQRHARFYPVVRRPTTCSGESM